MKINRGLMGMGEGELALVSLEGMPETAVAVIVDVTQRLDDVLSSMERFGRDDEIDVRVFPRRKIAMRG